MPSKAARIEALPKPSPRFAVGAQVDSTCGKCKKTTPHVVANKIGNVPTRVQCSVCSSVHAYKAPRRSSRREAEPALDKRDIDVVWKDAMRRARGPAQSYSARGYYEVGSRLSHLSFGEGVVARLSSTTVCEVIFETGTVKLLMGSAAER